MSLVRTKKNPITGALVVADVVLKTAPQSTERAMSVNFSTTSCCSAAKRFPPHKVPAAINFVPALGGRRIREAQCVAMRNVIVTGGSRGLGLGIARKLTEAGYRAIAVARKENSELTAAMQEAEIANPGSFHFVPFDLAEIEGIARSGQDVAEGLRPDLRAGEQRRHEFRWRSRPHAQFADRATGACEHALADRPHQICGALHDGRWRRAHRQYRLDHRLHRLQRSFGLRRDESIDHWLHPIAGARSRPHGSEREFGRARLRRYRYDPGLKDEQRQQIERRSALKRLADIDDVANAVEFLLSDKAKNITGTVLTVDAGNTA